MDILTDTNILLRAFHPKAAKHSEAILALKTLQARGSRICVAQQNIYEFWAVATRPEKDNGFGLRPEQASEVTKHIEMLFRILRDPPELYGHWRSISVTYGVSGKKTHDARLVAAMAVHGITQILTYNIDDCARFDGIHLMHPALLEDLPRY